MTDRTHCPLCGEGYGSQGAEDLHAEWDALDKRLADAERERDMAKLWHEVLGDNVERSLELIGRLVAGSNSDSEAVAEATAWLAEFPAKEGA